MRNVNVKPVSVRESLIKIISALSEESSGVIKREDGSRAQRKFQLPRWSIINDSNFINS